MQEPARAEEPGAENTNLSYVCACEGSLPGPATATVFLTLLLEVVRTCARHFCNFVGVGTLEATLAQEDSLAVLLPSFCLLTCLSVSRSARYSALWMHLHAQAGVAVKGYNRE
jgi:hypothetical protein